VVLLGEWCAWAPVLQGSRHVRMEQWLEDMEPVRLILVRLISTYSLMAERVQHVVRDGRTWRRAPRPISSPGAPHCTAAGSILV
jgi:hypothetical protein